MVKSFLKICERQSGGTNVLHAGTAALVAVQSRAALPDIVMVADAIGAVFTHVCGRKFCSTALLPWSALHLEYMHLSLHGAVASRYILLGDV